MRSLESGNMGSGSMIAGSLTTESGALRADEELVREAQGGQVQAFSVLVERNQGLARAIAYSVSNDYSITEDLSQEAMVTAWLRLADLDEPKKFRPWLAAIVRNTARYWRRHQGRHAPRAQYGLDLLEQIPDSDCSPLDRALQNEDLQNTHDALQGLATRYREPLLLYYSLGESHAEVASALGVSEAVARQRLCRARKKLKQGVSGVERTGRRLRNQASAAAAVLLVIQSRQAWATHATGLGSQSALASPKLFIGLGALAGGALVACVGAIALLLGGNEPAVAQASRAGAQPSGSPPAAISPRATPTSTEEAQSEPSRALVRIGSGKVKERAARQAGTSAPAKPSALRATRDSNALSLRAGSGRIRKHGPARLLDSEAGPSQSRPLLRPSIDMRAVHRDLWSED